MWRLRVGSMLESMNATTIHLALELRQRDDCLSGQIVGEHGKATFSGWLGLISTLDALVGPEADVEALQTIHAEQGDPSVSIIETPRGVRYLRGRLRGVILAPDEPGWDEARLAYNLTVQQTPALIALPADEGDVVAVVDFAHEHGLRVAPQRTGHNAEPLGSLDDVILLKTDRLQGVEIDVERRVARVGAGVKWGDVVPRASELGLAALHGSTPDVSVVGYSLGGGVGWYARSHGLSANSVVAIELVTADGELRRVDHEHDPELFWALRGGGGNFGVVTAIEVRLFPIPEVYAGLLFFPWERTAEVLHAWHRWLPGVPDQLTSVARVLQFPPIDEVPAPFRGRSFVVVEAFYTGSERDGSELLRPLRELGPELDTVTLMPPAGLAELHMDPPNPLPYLGGHQLLDELTSEAIDEIVALVGPGSGSTLVSYELRHCGGALAREADDHGALASLPGSYLTFGVGLVFGEESWSETRARLDRIAHALGEFDTGRRYLNFSEQAADPASFYTPQTWARLQAVKADVDPDRLFLANHAIDPAR
jgi:FAD/FMN-containing dehydrogenase